jgi:hypothetical protein
VNDDRDDRLTDDDRDAIFDEIRRAAGKGREMGYGEAVGKAVKRARKKVQKAIAARNTPAVSSSARREPWLATEQSIPGDPTLLP